MGRRDLSVGGDVKHKLLNITELLILWPKLASHDSTTRNLIISFKGKLIEDRRAVENL